MKIQSIIAIAAIALLGACSTLGKVTAPAQKSVVADNTAPVIVPVMLPGGKKATIVAQPYSYSGKNPSFSFITKGDVASPTQLAAVKDAGAPCQVYAETVGPGPVMGILTSGTMMIGTAGINIGFNSHASERKADRFVKCGEKVFDLYPEYGISILPGG